MSVAVYVRVSTVSQSEAGQRLEIQKWLRGNGFDASDVVWYADKESGDTLKRPEFEQLQRDVFNGVIKTIVVYKLDRLSRTLKDGIETLSKWCSQGVRVVSVTQQIDFSGTVGQMIASVLFAVAQMEQETRRERQAAGIEAAKERGVYTGRPKGAVKPGVNPARALELQQEGLSLREIANSMGVSVSSVKRYIRATKKPAEAKSATAGAT